VAIGDSLTHGFQSAAIFNTDLSHPAIIAYEMGMLDRFRFPRYDGHGGLPLNIELLTAAGVSRAASSRSTASTRPPSPTASSPRS
jgi:hypothetical protein